jgi:hypothetical protein
MSKREKLINRFKSKPTDFTWAQLEALLVGLGYELLVCGKTSGSRVKFIHVEYPSIFMHKPHPSLILKKYQIEYLYDFLTSEHLI